MPLNHGNGMLRQGDLIEVVTGGSGGYGAPSGRDRAAVAQDLADGRIDRETAEAVYGLIRAV